MQQDHGVLGRQDLQPRVFSDSFPNGLISCRMATVFRESLQ
jgi:hypothetical protein